MTAYTNPLSKLAPGTPPHTCVHTILRSSKATFTGIPLPHGRTSPAHLLTGFNHQQRKRTIQNHSADGPTVFNIHNLK
jgi:hypothetical protein